jgi:hypothetical protein
LHNGTALLFVYATDHASLSHSRDVLRDGIRQHRRPMRRSALDAAYVLMKTGLSGATIPRGSASHAGGSQPARGHIAKKARRPTSLLNARCAQLSTSAVRDTARSLLAFIGLLQIEISTCKVSNSKSEACGNWILVRDSIST